MRAPIAKTRPTGRSRRALLPAISVAAVGLLLGGCVTIAEHRKLERDVRSLSRGGSGERVADLGAQLAEIERRLDTIEGRLGDVQHDSERALEEARRARAEAAGGGPVPLDPMSEPPAYRSELAPETPSDSAAARSGAPLETPAAALPPVDPEDRDAPPVAGASAQEVAEYRAAHAAWRSGDLDGCIDQFKRFLQTHPASPYADDAAYWMAECHFKQGDYKSAILRFDDVVTRYPEGDKSGDALYRQGEALLKLGPGYSKAASKAFERVIEEYPNSPRASEAKRQLELLGAG
jgi:tol-pal system protein YbgF